MATGGYVTAASWHRSALYEIAETRGVGNYSADEMNRMFGASCSDIVTHALGLLFQEFAARSLPSVRTRCARTRRTGGSISLTHDQPPAPTSLSPTSLSHHQLWSLLRTVAGAR
jgi:hypothetical protein